MEQRARIGPDWFGTHPKSHGVLKLLALWPLGVQVLVVGLKDRELENTNQPTNQTSDKPTDQNSDNRKLDNS